MMYQKNVKFDRLGIPFGNPTVCVLYNMDSTVSVEKKGDGYILLAFSWVDLLFIIQNAAGSEADAAKSSARLNTWLPIGSCSGKSKEIFQDNPFYLLPLLLAAVALNKYGSESLADLHFHPDKKNREQTIPLPPTCCFHRSTDSTATFTLIQVVSHPVGQSGG